MEAIERPVRDRPILDRSATEEMRRRQILDAVVEVVCERGVAGISLGLVLARAGVTRRAFCECFDGLEAAVVAVMEGALERVAVLAAGALEDCESWQDGIRAALAAVLGFFDEEPGLAQVCLVESLAAGPVVRRERERIVGAFRALVVERVEGEVSHASPLAAEGVHASVMGIVHTRLLAREHAPLIELLGPLMGIVVAPFMDETQLAREIERGDRLAREMLARRARSQSANGTVSEAEGWVEIPDVLRRSRAFRVRQCLLYVAAQDGRGSNPSNREVAEGIGLPHRGQASALLSQLVRLGLIAKHTRGPGHSNEWRLTQQGILVAQALQG